MQGRDDRSLGEHFTELAQETSTLMRQQVNLAKTEMSQKASRAGRHAGILAAGGALAYAGLLAILASLPVVLLGAGVARIFVSRRDTAPDPLVSASARCLAGFAEKGS